MAFLRAGESPTDEPFKQHLTPLDVAHSVQGALSALWLSVSAGERSPVAIEQAALRVFAGVEHWWLQLKDRTGGTIVSATEQAFGFPAWAREEFPHRMETMVTFLPSQEFAAALFSAWLLQPEHARTPADTAQAVRQILERQLRAAVEDMVTFASQR